MVAVCLREMNCFVLQVMLDKMREWHWWCIYIKVWHNRVRNRRTSCSSILITFSQLYYTITYCTLWHYTKSYYTTQIALCCIIVYNAIIRYFATLDYAILNYTIRLCYSVLHYAIIYILYYTMLHYTIAVKQSIERERHAPTVLGFRMSFSPLISTSFRISCSPVSFNLSGCKSFSCCSSDALEPPESKKLSGNTKLLSRQQSPGLPAFTLNQKCIPIDIQICSQNDNKLGNDFHNLHFWRFYCEMWRL